MDQFLLDVVAVSGAQDLPVDVHFLVVDLGAVYLDLHEIPLQLLDEILLRGLPRLLGVDVTRPDELELREVEGDDPQVFEIEHNQLETLHLDHKTLDDLLRRVLLDLVAGEELFFLLIETEDVLAVEVEVPLAGLFVLGEELADLLFGEAVGESGRGLVGYYERE